MGDELIQRSRIERALASNSAVVLVGVGALLVVAGLVAGLAAAVATALIVMGAATIVLGALLPRLEGQVSVGPGGVQATLRQLNEVAARSTEEGLSTDERLLAIGSAFDELQRAPSLARRAITAGTPAPPTSRSIADEIIRGIQDTRRIDVDDVPVEALTAIRKQTGNAALTLRKAERRVGRGAPRWHLKASDDTWWVVSNTRHGWSARPYEFSDSE